MNRLDSVIRLHRWKLDEQRRKLADLEVLRQKFIDQRRRLDDEVTAESALVAGSVDARATLGPYLDAARARAARIESSTLEVAREIELTQAAIEEAYREVKSYELARAEQERRAANLRARREQYALDEMALAMRRRGAPAA
ncbi:MAG: hypothetical protein AB7K86_06840 [Rhodospirillales bacterium]